MTARRGVRTVTVGLLLGLLLSFIVVGRAQAVEAKPVPLVTALQAAALAADLNIMVASVPVESVYLPLTSGDWRSVLFGMAEAYGLTICEVFPGTVLVTGAVGAATVCAEPEPVEVVPVVEVLPEPVEVVEPVEVDSVAVPLVGLVYRVRVLQLDETRAIDAGLDWSGGVLQTAGSLIVAGYEAANGFWPSSSLGELVRFLESEGVAMRLEDVELRSHEGATVRFNRGGSISVNLVGGGGATITEQYAYGLGLELTGDVEADTVALSYSFTDSAPSNVGDPTNVQLASTTASSLVEVPCGHSVVVAAVGSKREGVQGQGLPVAAAVPGVGYIFGVGGVTQGRSSFVVTVDVGCIT